MKKLSKHPIVAGVWDSIRAFPCLACDTRLYLEKEIYRHVYSESSIKSLRVEVAGRMDEMTPQQRKTYIVAMYSALPLNLIECPIFGLAGLLTILAAGVVSFKNEIMLAQKRVR